MITARMGWMGCMVMFIPLFLTTVIFAGESTEGLEAKPEDLQWFQDARFGLFIHWGPVSLKGTEIGWSRGGERKFPPGKGEIPVEEYDTLYQRFNPVKFNADEWVATAKAAGMKYLVFTTKHHDGFCMFDSAYTDYKITNSPFKRDVTAELADACHRAGIRLGFYYSPPDWRHPDFFTDNHARYVEYLHNHLRELCTRYGKLDILWFDGLGAKPETWDAVHLLPMIRKLQPGILINNRSGLPADFDTPEQEIGHFQIDRAWESCITICRQWAWKPNDTMKSLKECVDMLIRCAGGDGNLLLNVGPMPTGEIEPRQVERLKEVGGWMEKYGEGIYGTRGGPFQPGDWGASTHRGNVITLFIMAWKPAETLRLPAIEKKIVNSEVLTGGRAKVQQSEKQIEITLAAKEQNPIATVIRLELDGPASEIAPQPVAPN